MDLSNKLLKIEGGELPKVLDFALLGALLQAGISVGLASADTLFLSKIGAEKLPLIYLLTPLIFFAYIPIYSYLTSRIGINNVFRLTISILAAGGILISLLLNTGGEFENLTLYAAKLYATLWYIALYTLFWNFVDGYFDILDAKRVFSALSAGSALGAALGGAMVTILSRMFPVHDLFLAWGLIAVASFPVLNRCLKRWRPIESDCAPIETSRDIVSETRSLIQTFRNSSFAVLLGGLLFLTMIVTLICEYQFSHVFSQGRTSEELASLFGILFFVVHSINLFINLFVFNRLVLVFGVRNIALVQPVVYTIAFVLFIFDHSFLAGVFGFFAFHGILTSIDYNNTNLLINALPKDNKRQLRTFIEGICEPMANAAAGLFLIYVVTKISPVQISTIGLISAIGCLALAAALRTAYLRSMVSNLRKSWLDLSSDATNSLNGQVLGLNAIEENLRTSENLYPADRRRLESAIIVQGLKSVPLCVRILKDRSYGYKSRSVAARALAHLASAQLDAISEELIFHETEKASQYAARKSVFSAASRTSLGQSVLIKYCTDQQLIIIDFVLELLALNGRVANFELLLSSLRSTNKKERADAIETIQQACDAKTNRLILPLLSTSFVKQAEQNTEIQCEVSGNDLFDALKLAFESPNPLEAAAAAEALISLAAEIDRESEAIELLRSRLAVLGEMQNPPAIIVETIVSALISESSFTEHSRIRKIALMQQSDFFTGFSSDDLYHICQDAKLLHSDSATSLDLELEEMLYLVITGTVSVEGHVFEPLSIVGEQTLYGFPAWTAEGIAGENVTLLAISRAALFERVRNDAGLSIYLLGCKKAFYEQRVESKNGRVHATIAGGTEHLTKESRA